MYSKFLKLLEQNQLKVADVVKGTGVPYSTFTDWKAGRYSPKLEKIKKIADFFHVSMNYFYEDESETITEVEMKLLLLLKRYPEIEQIVANYVRSSDDSHSLAFFTCIFGEIRRGAAPKNSPVRRRGTSI